MTAWIKNRKANQVVIIDDDVANDEYMIDVLEMAIPEEIAIGIFTKEDGVLFFSQGLDEPTILLVKGPEALNYLVDHGIAIDEVDVGGMGARNDRSVLYKNISTSPSENEEFKQLLEKNVTDAGYTSWGSANADSTAMALMAYSALDDQEKADKAYDLLCKFESKTTGVFTYDGEENLLATKDALTALGYYTDHLIGRIVIDPEDPTEPTTKKNAEKTTANKNTKETTKKSTSKKSPATGNNAAAAGVMAITAAGACLLLAKKRKLTVLNTDRTSQGVRFFRCFLPQVYAICVYPNSNLFVVSD